MPVAASPHNRLFPSTIRFALIVRSHPYPLAYRSIVLTAIPPINAVEAVLFSVQMRPTGCHSNVCTDVAGRLFSATHSFQFKRTPFVEPHCVPYRSSLLWLSLERVDDANTKAEDPKPKLP